MFYIIPTRSQSIFLQERARAVYKMGSVKIKDFLSCLDYRIFIQLQFRPEYQLSWLSFILFYLIPQYISSDCIDIVEIRFRRIPASSRSVTVHHSISYNLCSSKWRRWITSEGTTHTAFLLLLKPKFGTLVTFLTSIKDLNNFILVGFYLFIYGLIINAVSSSEHISLNGIVTF